MARRSWFENTPITEDTSAAAPAGVAAQRGSPFSGSVERLESWQRAIEDGIIEPHEVAEQKERLVKLLRELEPMLDDAQHEKVTRVLEEWAVLQAMHGTLLVEEFGGGRDSFQAAVPPDEAPES